MSYDVYLVVQSGDNELADVWARNMTSNVAPFWREIGVDLTGELNGKPGGTIVGVLREALLKYNRTKYLVDYDDFIRGDGKWGNVPIALEFLEELSVACKRHNRAILQVSY